jgi:hypothetical protein
MKKIILAALLLLSSVAIGNATTINFDDGTNGNVVGSYYSTLGVTFSNAIFADNFGLPGSSPPLGIASASAGFEYMFTKPDAIFASIAGGASSVSITGIDVGGNGLQIDAYDALVGGNLIASQQAFGSGAGVGQFFTLTDSASSIMRVEMYQVQNIYGDGIILDDFSFNPSTAPVPEPGTMMLLGLGMAGLALYCKRRQNKA